MTAWGAGAIYYSPIPNVVVRAGLAAIFVVATVLAFLLLPRRPRTLVGFFVTFAALVGLYFEIPASNYRNWEPEVAVTPYATIKNGRWVFLDYVETMNELRDRAQFYNTLTTNCTTSIWMHTRMNPQSPPLSWKILLSGYVPDYLYDLGRLDTTRPFAELEKLSRVNERAHAADKGRAFSQRIRERLPLPPSM